jgi:hypothetical protein
MGARFANREALSAGPAPTEPTEITARQSFQIRCLRNVHYHEDRERFFARWHRLTMFVVVLGGAATFAPLGRYWIAASVVTVAGLIDLVFDVSGKPASTRRSAVAFTKFLLTLKTIKAT